MLFNDNKKQLWILSETLLVITMKLKTKLDQFNITHEINAYRKELKSYERNSEALSVYQNFASNNKTCLLSSPLSL